MNYYNEHDKKAAAWLRELIKQGLISNGIVDERDIQQVKPKELHEYKQCHFFAGIGGWSYALRLAGICDDEPVWTGSCPCQPFSVAGRGLQKADERHLWPDFRNLIGECRPAIVFGEQVAGKGGREWFDGVSDDLEALGYAVGAADLLACCVGSPHQRKRIYWVADSQGIGWNGVESERTAEIGERARPVCDIADGWMVNPGRQRDESGGGVGNLGCPAEEKQGETQKRERSRNANSDSGIDGRRLAYAASERKHGISRDTAITGKTRDKSKQEPDKHCSTCWDDFDILNFRDGKQRRVEAGTFPLANGVPGRVGLLRGYGNAIVPQVASVFIKAAMNL